MICAGVVYQYVREALPDASILKLGMVYPLPGALIRDFAARVERLFVIEELDPFIEEQVRAMGLAVTGKEMVPLCGELSPVRVREAFARAGVAVSSAPAVPAADALPPRPPNMCPGCPHRGLFYTLNRLNAYVTGDIGCYTLGFMPPLNAMDTCVCMGASISNASGLVRVLPTEEQRRVVAVIGDSTFLHTGVNSLMEMAYNQAPATVVILDNRITAMTGRQENPTSGYTLSGQPAPEVNLADLCRVLGIRHVQVIDPNDLAATRQALEEEMALAEPSVVITNRPCCLIKDAERFTPGPALAIDQVKCTGCRACLRLGCPAIEWQPAADGSRKGKARIDPLLCNGCTVCAAALQVRRDQCESTRKTMSEKITNILLVGVGGQGILLASEILAEAFMLAGFDVKKSEIHGMSQRGGSVISHVRFGREVFSPTVPEGEGDILFGFELLETYRCLPLLRPGAKVVVNDYRIAPPTVLLGQASYPDDLAERIRARFADFLLVDGLHLAQQAGDARAANTVLLGAVSKRLAIDEAVWLEALTKMVPAKALEVNRTAFAMGRAL